MKSIWKWLPIAVAILAMIGCGKDQAVMVGNPGEKGLIKESLDEAKDIGAKANEREQSNEKDLYGG